MTNSSNSYEALLERIWTDEDFKKRFIADPKPVLADAGVKVFDSLVRLKCMKTDQTCGIMFCQERSNWKGTI